MHSLHRFLLIDFSMTFDVNHVLLSKLRTLQVPSYLFFYWIISCFDRPVTTVCSVVDVV